MFTFALSWPKNFDKKTLKIRNLSKLKFFFIVFSAGQYQGQQGYNQYSQMEQPPYGSAQQPFQPQQGQFPPPPTRYPPYGETPETWVKTKQKNHKTKHNKFW